MQTTCDGCDGFFDMEMLAIEYLVPRRAGHIGGVGKSISAPPPTPVMHPFAQDGVGG